MHVLVVEPDKKLYENLAQSFIAAGESIAHAVSAQEAIHAIDEKKPNVVVLELHLKKHNGIEFLYELRSYRDWQDIPVVIWSFAHPDKFVSDEALMNQLGIIEYLYKPVTSLSQVVKAAQRIKASVLL